MSSLRRFIIIIASYIFILREILISREILLPIREQRSPISMQIIPMRTLIGGVWPQRIFFRVAGVFLLLMAACLAQAPSSSSTANTTPASAPGYLDPLPQDTGAAGLTQELRKLQTTGRLMMVTAHPDDEDGGLLTLEARGKGVQTLLMTLTRGEGGQNKLGSSLFDVLGVLRTLELLAADRYYGVEQRFSRVADFGYSKTAEETFQKWGGHDVPLSDMVRVIRTFRPDVLIARFSGTDNDGHGHHQASAILTREAFRAAADPKRFPEQIKEGLQPWQPKKLYIGNVCGFGANTCADENWTVKINTGEEDPALGMSYVQFAIEGLKHQQSQGLADIKIPSGPRYAFYKLADSVLPNTKDASGHEKDLFDGIDTSLPGLTAKLGTHPVVAEMSEQLRKIGLETDEAKASSSSQPPSSEVLLDLLRRTRSAQMLTQSSSLTKEDRSALAQQLAEKELQVQRALNLALGVSAEAVASAGSVSPGEQVQYELTVHNGPKADLGIRLEANQVKLDAPTAPATMVHAGQQYSKKRSLVVAAKQAYTRPYWHRMNPETESVNTLDEPQFVTLPFPPFPFHDQVGYSTSHRASPADWGALVPLIARVSENGAAKSREVAVVPEFSVSIEPGELVLPAGRSSQIEVRVGVTSNAPGTSSGTLKLEVPALWKAEPAEKQFQLAHGDTARDFEFRVTPAKLAQGRVDLHAILEAGGAKYTEGYTLVTREDLGSFYYFQPAIQRVSIVDVKVPKELKVGYIMGAGDDIPTVLQQIGMNVTLIPADKLASENLSQYASIVLGVRAYDTQKELTANNKKLLDFVSDGGTLVVQNNNSVGDFNNGHLTPYPAELSRARVSVEEAPVQILAPDDRVFHYPNEISQRDFDGWVQERGLYFMNTWDDHFKPLLSCHDPNEPDQKGGLLMAKYGKGTYIYTGYAFFRQLPAGVPGAIRLFVNLVSAGKEAASR
jgi:LmbE family N-acetylglucosaminyl deacetylase